ncbi:pesticidal protein Cry7Aa [Flavobacterium sp. ZT3R18]|uniref:glycoside hydrolase family 130 protein n=1 Tax=Flavobacterium sp. ZT3R18 TaxID=2594429 RepID=UPI00117A5C17|nr:pesticidal protein Cry7Aa [Flavobacterium sp. ZT3R18]TRX31900.1 pesticidal protein Cry7Aa [Flavobacterium sp. ZT3R18]
MIAVKKEGVLIQKTELIFENEGVLNPAVIKEGDCVHLFYRAVSKGNYSSIGYCKLKGPLTVEHRDQAPVIVSEFDYESHGVEDPRIVKIEGIYYLTYTAFDGVNALGALATSSDLMHWDKKGIIVPQVTYNEFNALTANNIRINNKYFRYNNHQGVIQKQEPKKKVLLWDKNIILFPRKIDGKFIFLHRIKPDIQIVVAVRKLEELNSKFWVNYFANFDKCIVMKPKYEHEASYIGGGCPPIETQLGWLIIYHGVQDTIKGYVYSACAALLDLKNPMKEIARLPYPLFKPELIWELKGEVNNVCFPTGTALFEDTLYIYYGAADERIGTASVSISELMKELMLNTVKNEK